MGGNHDRPTLQVYVAEHCWTCDEATRLADAVRRRFASVRIEIIDLDRDGVTPPASVFAVPTYVLDGRTISLGNPTPDELVARIAAIVPATPIDAGLASIDTGPRVSAFSLRSLFGLSFDTHGSFVAEFATIRHVAAGDVLHRLGAHPQVLYLLVEGRVRIVLPSTDGTSHTLACLDPGRVFGEMTFLGQELGGASAEALEASLVWSFDRAAVERLLLARPGIALHALAAMSRRATDLKREIDRVAFHEAPPPPQC